MRAGIGELFSRDAGGAVRLAYLLTLDHVAAQTLTRRAFVRALGRFQDLRGEAFPYYLRRTIVALARRHARRQRICRFLGPSLSKVAPDPTGPTTDPGDRVWAGLQVLSHRRRAALVLRYHEGLSERETADLLGCSARTVASLVASGMQSMRSHGRDEIPATKPEDHLRRILRSRAEQIHPASSVEERVSTRVRHRRRLLMGAIGLMVTGIVSVTTSLGLRALDESRSAGPITDPVILPTEQGDSHGLELRGFVASTGEACYELFAVGIRKGDLCVLPDYDQELAFAVTRVPDLGKTIVWGWVADEVSTLEAIRADGLPVRDSLRNPVPLHSHPDGSRLDGRYFIAVFGGKKGTLHARAGDRRLLSAEGWVVPDSRTSRKKVDKSRQASS